MAGSAVVGILRTILSADSAELATEFEKAGKSVTLWTQDLTKAGLSAKQVGEAMTNSLTRSLENVNKLTKEFSGAGIAKSADEYAAAIKRMGGATSLTASEQAKVNGIMREALEKYKALGQEAPAHLVALEQATRKLAPATQEVNSKIDTLVGGLKSAAGVIGISFGAAAVIGGIKKLGAEVFDTASNIKDLADRLDISTDAVQQYGFAAKQAGSDMETVTTGIAKMTLQVADGGKETVAALTKMGLKFADIRAMSPEQQFDAITEAIRKVEDPTLQADLAVQMFGRNGQQLLPAIRDGMRDVGRSAEIMSGSTIRDLEAAQQAWENFGNKVTIVTGNAIGGLITLSDRLSSMANVWQLVSDSVSKGGVAYGIGMQLARAKVEEFARSVESLTPAQKATIEILHGTGKSAEYMAKEMHLNAEAVAKYVSALKKVPPPNAKTREQLDAEAAAAQKRTEELLKLQDAWTGKDLEQRVKGVTDAFNKLSPAEKAAAESNSKFVKTVMDLFSEGAKLPPKLLDIVDREIRLMQAQEEAAETMKRYKDEQAAVVRATEEGVQAYIKAEQHLASLRDRTGQAMDIIKLMPSVMGAWTHQVNETAAAIKKQAEREREAEKAARDHAEAMSKAIGFIGSAFDQLAALGGDRVKKITQYLDIAIKSVQNYVSALTASARTASVAWGMLTFGVSIAVNEIGKALAKKQAKAEVTRQVEDLTRALKVLGETPLKAPGITFRHDELDLLTAQLDLAKVKAEELATAMREGPGKALTGLASALGVTDTAFETLADAQEHLTALQTQYASASVEDQAKIQKEIDATTATIKTQQAIIDATAISSQSAATGVAASIVGIVNANVKAGQSFVQAVTGAAPAINALRDQLMAAGLDGGGAFNFINDELRLVTDTIAGPALTAVEGYGAGIRGLSDAGILTQEMFSGLTEQIGHTYDSLIAQGQDGQAVLLAMQGPLQAAWEAQEKFGIKADDATQALIDQAVQAGIVGEGHKTQSQQLIDAMNKVKDVLDIIANKLAKFIDMFGKGDNSLAGQARSAAGLVQKALDGIKPPTLRMPVVVDGAEFDGGPSSGEGYPVLDQPVRRVVKAGLAYMKPGDIAGMPSLGGLSGNTRPLVIHNTIDIDGRALAKNQKKYLAGEWLRSGV